MYFQAFMLQSIGGIVVSEVVVGDIVYDEL